MFDFKVNLYGNMQVTVVAENKEEAERILKDTIDSITVKDIREKISNRDNVEIKDSGVVLGIQDKQKNREAER